MIDWITRSNYDANNNWKFIWTYTKKPEDSFTRDHSCTSCSQRKLIIKPSKIKIINESQTFENEFKAIYVDQFIYHLGHLDISWFYLMLPLDGHMFICFLLVMLRLLNCLSKLFDYEHYSLIIQPSQFVLIMPMNFLPEYLMIFSCCSRSYPKCLCRVFYQMTSVDR